MRIKNQIILVVIKMKNEKYFKTFIAKGLIKQKSELKKINDNNLIFTTLSTRETVDFSGKNDPLTFL